MPFPIAHGLIGASIVAACQPKQLWGQKWAAILSGAILGVLPDFDYLLIWIFGLGESWHRGFSHSISFGAALGILSYASVSRPQFKKAIILGVAAISHGLLDALVSIEGGVELLWPFSSYRFAFGLLEYPDFLDLRFNQRDDLLIVSGLLTFLKTSVYEFLVFVPIFLSILWIKRLKANQDVCLISTEGKR